jgi:hypothetical protein
VRWKKVNHRHALKGYDYFVQGPKNKRWPWYTSGTADVIQHLREHYGREMLDTERQDRWGYPIQEKNPVWYLDRARNRIWIRADVLTMLTLRGVDPNVQTVV